MIGLPSTAKDSILWTSNFSSLTKFWFHLSHVNFFKLSLSSYLLRSMMNFYLYDVSDPPKYTKTGKLTFIEKYHISLELCIIIKFNFYNYNNLVVQEIFWRFFNVNIHTFMKYIKKNLNTRNLRYCFVGNLIKTFSSPLHKIL